VSVENSAEELIDIYSLKNGFGLLKEIGKTNAFISLILLDLSRRSLQKLHTIEYNTDDIEIVVNKADPTAFILNHYINDERFSQNCNVVEKTIIIGDLIEIEFYPECFCDKFVYGLNCYKSDEDSKRVSIFNLYLKCFRYFELISTILKKRQKICLI
jgi:hypothetical protein